MHGPRGNGAREKAALMPDPLWGSSFGFTTLDSRRGYGHGAPTPHAHLVPGFILRNLSSQDEKFIVR